MENIEYINLFDIYGSLLTAKQQDTFKMYYMSDLSLREIAENLNVSFQSVRNSLNDSKKKLIYYEEVLKVDYFLKELNKIDNDKVKECINKYNKGSM